MRQSKFWKSFAVITLLLIFSQKIGVGLYLHEWLHVKEVPAEKSGDTKSSISKACHCVDDFQIPFTNATENFDFAQAVVFNSTYFFYLPEFLTRPVSTTSLRGPPTAV